MLLFVAFARVLLCGVTFLPTVIIIFRFILWTGTYQPSCEINSDHIQGSFTMIPYGELTGGCGRRRAKKCNSWLSAINSWSLPRLLPPGRRACSSSLSTGATARFALGVGISAICWATWEGRYQNCRNPRFKEHHEEQVTVVIFQAFLETLQTLCHRDMVFRVIRKFLRTVVLRNHLSI
jgi:hypothetical protein